MTILLSFYTEFVLFVGLNFFLILGLCIRSNWKNPKCSEFLFFNFIIVLFLILFALLTSEGYWHWNLSFFYEGKFYPTIFLTTTPLYFLSKVVLLLLTIICVYLHQPLFTNGRSVIEYGLLILFITLASFLVISANDLGFVFIALELQTLALFVFVHLGTKTAETSEAAFRYFANASYSSTCFLFGISLIYGLFGSFNLDQLHSLLTTIQASSIYEGYFAIIINFACILIFFSIFFKLTLAPYHHWVGDIYEGASSGYVGSYFTLVTKIPVWILLIKLFICLEPILGTFLWSIQFVGIFSIFLGNIYAFSTFNFRRFWALGSIGHMGQILLGLSLLSSEGILVASLYLFLYLSANIFIWGFMLIIQKKRPNLNVSYIDFFKNVFRLISLSHRQRGKSILFLFVFASLAGIPPAFGFFSKFYLLLALYQAQNFWLFIIVFFLSLISLAYYLRLMRLIFFQNSYKNELSSDIKQPYFSEKSSWALTFAFLLHSFFGFWLIKCVFVLLLCLL